MKVKRITSLVLTWSFIILMISSLVLYVIPSGKVAHWANWAFLGLSKEQWAALHTNNGYLFLLACALHIYFNFSHILSYMRNRQRELTGMNINSIVAFLLVLAIGFMTLVGMPPVSWIQDLNGHFKSQAEAKFGVPPYGHAELSSLQEFARRTGLNLEEMILKLKAAGFEGIESNARIEDIAVLNKVSPQALINAVSDHKDTAKGGTISGESYSGTIEHRNAGGVSLGGGSGYGQKTLEAVCQDLGVDGKVAMQMLKTHGYKGKLSDTLKVIAESKGERPSSLVPLLRELAGNPE